MPGGLFGDFGEAVAAIYFGSPPTRWLGGTVELNENMSMTNEQIAGRLAAVRKAADSLHGGGYSYDSGAPSEACWDVRWLLVHIDGLNLSLADSQAREARLRSVIADCLDCSRLVPPNSD
jgi:hypothetical protein